MIQILKPFSLEKNLGKAYNDAMSKLNDDEWGVLCDLDTCFLTHDAGTILERYAERNPDAGLLTCFANRIHPLAKDQLLDGVVSENTNFSYHIDLAYNQMKHLFETTVLNHEVSGFLMMISKKTWNQIKFTEDLKCLGVDNDYCFRLMDAGKSILRMNGLYIWHTYRLRNGITDKTHLK